MHAQSEPVMNDRTQERAKRDRIERLRQRAQRLSQDDPRAIVVVGIILGLLDLLADEL
jgi:hypothetical protein